MTELLLKLFVKNYANTKDASVRSSYGTLAGTVGIITNAVIAVAKLIIGFVAHSVAVTADAVNNLSDAGSSVITLIGFKLSGRPADKEHPYGHARYEYITGLIVAMLVTFLGGVFLIDSVKKIFAGSETRFEWAMIVILAFSIAVKLWQCLFYTKLGKKISSESLKASAADSRNDCITTGVVLIGAFISKAFGVSVDGYLGAAVAVFILISGVKLILSTANPLIGTAPDEGTIHSLYDKILSYDGVIGVHDMIIHSYGANRIFCSAHVEVPANGDMLTYHDIIDNIEEDVFNETGVFLVLHMDPIAVGDERVDAMKAVLNGIMKELPEGCSFHDFRVVFGPTHDNVLFDLIVPHGCKTPESQIIDTVKDSFMKQYPKSVMKIKLDTSFANINE